MYMRAKKEAPTTVAGRPGRSVVDIYRISSRKVSGKCGRHEKGLITIATARLACCTKRHQQLPRGCRPDIPPSIAQGLCHDQPMSCSVDLAIKS